jgi:hypothetical protein
MNRKGSLDPALGDGAARGSLDAGPLAVLARLPEELDVPESRWVLAPEELGATCEGVDAEMGEFNESEDSMACESPG